LSAKLFFYAGKTAEMKIETIMSEFSGGKLKKTVKIGKINLEQC
jgi:hypothetical protein